MRNYIVTVISMMFAFLSCIPLYAAEPSVVRVGAFDYYPAIFKDSDGVVKGFYVDALSELGRRENIRFEYVYGSWSAGLERIKSGEVDLLTSVAYTDDRAKFLDYAKNPLLTVWGELYAPPDSEIDGIREVQGKRIGIMKGDFNARNFIDLVGKFDISCEFVELAGFEDVFKAIAAKKVDAGVVNSTFGVARVKEYGLRSTGVVFNPFDIYFAVAKGKNQSLLGLLDRYLTTWRYQGDSAYNRARQKWSHGTAGTIQLIPRWLVNALTALVVLALCSAAFIIVLRKQVRSKTRSILESAKKYQLLHARQEAILSAVPDIIMEADTDRVYTWSSGAGIDFFGEDVVGKEYAYYFAGEQNTGEIVRPLYDGTEQLMYVESWQRRKDGEIRLLAWRCRALVDEQGVVTGTLSTARDITEMKQTEASLLAANDKLQEQYEELQVNEESLRDQNDELLSVEEMLRVQINEYETSRKLLKEREESLDRQNNLFSSLLKILPIGVFMVEAPTGKPLVANEAAFQLLGRGILPDATKENLSDVYNTFKAGTSDQYPPEEMPVILGMDGVTSHVDDMEVERPDGTKILLEIFGAPVTDDKGNIWASLVSFSDITERKRAEEAIQKRIVALTQPLESGTITFEELFNIEEVQRLQDEFAKATGVASIITHPDGTPLTAPSNFTRLCNDIIRKTEKGCASCYKSDAALGRYNPDGPNIQPCLSGGLWDAGAGITVGGQHIANWLIGQVRDEAQSEDRMSGYAREIGADETEFMAAFHDVPSMSHEHFEQIARSLFTLANQLSTTAYQNVLQARFINERKLAEEQLKSLTQRLQLAASSAHLGIWDWNVRENWMVWDDRMFELYGITRETFPSSIDAWMNGLHPEDKEAAIAECQAALNGEKEFDTCFRVVHPDGTLKYLKGKGLVMFGADGTAERMIGINYDVSDVKKSEDEKAGLESQLQQAQKMESVGRLAGGVAHDFNNMLTVILGHAQLGLMRLDPADRVCADLHVISDTAERSADLTRQLLAFARKQTVAPKVLDLNETVSGMLKMLQRLIGENIQLTWQPAAELWLTKMDPSQIDQILANLCVNARDAIEDTGRITIETSKITIDAEYCAANLEAAPGEYIRLCVSDDGVGMDKETLTHIFEPFYTTKELGKGTGLGLATVYGAVRQNNGFINVYSEPGQGTTFSIYLPRNTDSMGSLKIGEGAATPVPMGRETILLVEDDPAILSIASQLLETQGYTVLSTGSPGEAIRLAREHVGEIRILITDVIMPEMNGNDLASKILSLYPDMKRLFMSGYTADVISHHGVLDEGVNFIQKPFSLHDMATKVREALDSK